MLQRRRATAEELAQGDDEIQRAHQRMEAELATGTEPQLEDRERSEAEGFESPGNPKDLELGSEEKPKEPRSLSFHLVLKRGPRDQLRSRQNR